MATSMDRFLSDFIGTLRDYIRIGASGFRFKNSSGVAEIKNSGDTAYAQMNASTFGVAGSNASNKVTLTAPAALGGNVAFVLPAAHGSSGQVLSDTDGNGTLGFVAPSSNGVLTQSENFSQADTTVTIFTPPANSVIQRVSVKVASAASGGSPTLCIGVSGTTARDMATTENDLKVAGIYEVKPMTDVTASPVAIIATVVANAQTFSGTITVEYANPA
jgi:hypothetical protein